MTNQSEQTKKKPIFVYKDLECFKSDDNDSLVTKKIFFFVIYGILTSVISIIFILVVHEFGHLLFSSFNGMIVFDFTDLNNIRFYAVIYSPTYWTYPGGVILELTASCIFSIFSMNRKSLLFSILGISLCISPIAYCCSFLGGYIPPGCDFLYFEPTHWLTFILLTIAASVLAVLMIIINFKHASRVIKEQKMVCII